MKAAVMYQQGEFPLYVDFPEPTVTNEDEVLVRVKAVAIKHFDKGRAAGKHYASETPHEGGKVVGGDGVCLLEDGTRVYGMGVSGMLAEKATIHRSRIVPVPEDVDDATAAALPNAVFGAAMALKFKAGIQPGDVVLINGATGFTGRVAVQIAKHYGAGKVIATGRNQQSLLSSGADQIISVTADDFATRIKQTSFDIVIDYLWGSTAEIILQSVKGDGSFTRRIRYVSVGSMMGDNITLSAANLRSVDLQLSGSGMGSWSKEQVGEVFREMLPEMFALAAEGKLTVETITVKLQDIADLWNTDVPGGKRLVVMI